MPQNFAVALVMFAGIVIGAAIFQFGFWMGSKK
jgi:hypothetical protein